MMTASMMRDRYDYKNCKSYEEEKQEDDLCLCGYKLRKETDYINNQNQLVSIMVCDSCGAIEHWVDDKKLIR